MPAVRIGGPRGVCWRGESGLVVALVGLWRVRLHFGRRRPGLLVVLDDRGLVGKAPRDEISTWSGRKVIRSVSRSAETSFDG